MTPEDQDDPNTQCMICLGVMVNPFDKSCCEEKHKEECNSCLNCNTPESLLDIHLNRS